MQEVGVGRDALHTSLYSVRDKTVREAALASLGMHFTSGLPTDAPVSVAAQRVTPVTEVSSPLMSEVLSEWLVEMESEWKPRTKSMNEKVAQKFIDWKGDVPISSVTKRDVSQYKLHLEKVLKAPRSRQDALVKASGLFTFAMNKRDYIEKNVFSGMFYRAVESKCQKESITKEEHTEAVSKVKGKNAQELMWMMKVLWHTGLRIGEVIQIRKEDYREVDGVWCISINTEDGKTVKTKDSVRDIPIAQNLIDEGILEVKPVFHWKSSSSAGERVRLAFKTIGIERTAHCYRYAISDRLRDLADVPDHVRYSILGHSHQVMTDRVYRGKQSLELMKEAINKI